MTGWICAGGGLSRRRFLGLAAGAAAITVLPACTRGADADLARVLPSSPRIGEAEAVRRAAGAATATVNLTARTGEADLGGITVNTWFYGNEIPGPEIRVRRGDVLRVVLDNQLPQDTTIHWHGIALRNDMDGVPGLTQDPVSTGSRFEYEFTVPEAGTHFFHPHVGVQLDRGLYAPLIVEDPDDGSNYDTELVLTLDDWLDGTGTDPDATLAKLLDEGMDHDMGAMNGMGHGDMGGMDHGDMSEMGGMGMRGGVLGMDVGDVEYPHMIANGRIADAPQVYPARPGQRIRLRLISAASDAAFRIGVPGVRMLVTHTDGFPIEPVEGDSVLLGMGERIDAIITMPDTAVPVLAAAEGRDGYAQVILNPGGSRDGRRATDAMLAALRAAPVLTVADLTAAERGALARRSPDITHNLVLGGPNGGYEWTINGQVFDHTNPYHGSLPIEHGQRVRLRFRNDTMMFHPMHLHGHTFQVIKRGGQNLPGPRKDTVVVLPHETIDVEFDADNPGQWLTHCHNIYHGEAGMMSVISYTE